MGKAGQHRATSRSNSSRGSKEQTAVVDWSEVGLKSLRVDDIPSEVRTLKITGNELRRLPDGLSTLVNLTKLHAGANRFEGIDELSGCKSMMLASLSFNSIARMPSRLILPALTCLDISHNDLHCFRECMEALSALESLIVLYLKGNPICLRLHYRDDVAAWLSKGVQQLDGEELSPPQPTQPEGEKHAESHCGEGGDDLFSDERGNAEEWPDPTGIPVSLCVTAISPAEDGTDGNAEQRERDFADEAVYVAEIVTPLPSLSERPQGEGFKLHGEPGNKGGSADRKEGKRQSQKSQQQGQSEVVQHPRVNFTLPYGPGALHFLRKGIALRILRFKNHSEESHEDGHEQLERTCEELARGTASIDPLLDGKCKTAQCDVPLEETFPLHDERGFFLPYPPDPESFQARRVAQAQVRARHLWAQHPLSYSC